MAFDAQLPQDQRLHPDMVVPEGLPIWGSIIDDIWALDHIDPGTAPPVGPDWLARAEECWCLRGVEPNHNKSVDAHEGEEVQGYFVHPTQHWMGVSLDKRRHLMQSTLMVLMRTAVVVAVIDRLIGKHGFVHSCRPCLRSIFQATYPWIASVRHLKRQRVVLPDDVWVELCVSSLLIGFAEFNLSSPWSRRIECTDASMSGLGRAFGVIPTHVAQAMARFSDHPSVYTSLKLPWSIGLNEEHACPLRKIRLPVERIKWTEIGVPWESTHITLGEADPICWAAEDRLRRPSDDGCRFIHPLDSAACVGAFSKGRSSSEALNKRCRKLASISLAGGHDSFYPWVPSKDNPADRPSRKFEPGARCGAKSEPDLESAEPILDIRELGVWPKDLKFFIHFCSGPRRHGDLIDAVEKSGAELGFNLHGVAIDPLAVSNHPQCPNAHGDLLQKQWLDRIMDLIVAGLVMGGFGSPPCSTVSAARHVPLTATCRGPGPRPLRARSQPWVCLPNRTLKEQHAVEIGSCLFLLVLGFLGEIAARGGWVGLEHPADRGREPYPSFFATKETRLLCRCFNLRYEVIHQCMYGALTKKATGLLLPRACSSLAVSCTHGREHPMLLGLDQHGHFRTTPAKYPHGLCWALAGSFCDRLSLAHRFAYVKPFAPKLGALSCASPWKKTRHDGAWDWPQPGPDFLAALFEAIHHRQVHSGTGAPQQ